MRSLIIGMGEVGSSLYRVVSRCRHRVEWKDIKPKKLTGSYDIMHVCLRYSDEFRSIVKAYANEFHPSIIDVCSTVPPGTTESLGPNAVHSTTRGLHPDLATSIETFVKHIGGSEARRVADYYDTAGLITQVHATSRTTELAHILSNSQYGINLMFADEMAKLCREYGVDYHEAVTMYNMTNNEGYERLGHKSKCRMLLTPPGGRIGGHCVVQGANLIPKRTPMLDMLAKYNERKPD